MKVLKSLALALGLVVLSSLPVVASASTQVAGVTFEDGYVLGGKPLVLNGAGLRLKMIIKVYAVALYLPDKDTHADGVLAQTGAKSIHIAMLRDVSGHDLSEGLIKGMLKNITSAELDQMQARIDELDNNLKSLGGVKRGELIQLDYVPGTGTHVTMNGTALGKDIPGDDFYRGLLKIWLGEQAPDEHLKANLLGSAFH